MIIDLTIPTHSYIYGLFLADVYLTEGSRNRGKLGIELKAQDSKILYKIKKELSIYNSTIHKRTRNTNFKENYESVSLTFFNKELRDEFKKLGFPSGKKSFIINTPKEININFWRGFFDGDGSLGITSNGFPFLSLITASDNIAYKWIDLLYGITGKQKTTKRNKRDNVYNIAVYKEDAQQVSEYLYKNASLYLPRKYKKYKEVMLWERPDTMKKRV